MNISASPPGTFSLFRERHSLAIRLWHWITFVNISASLLMVLLASTMFATKSNTSMVTEQVEKKGGVITPVQARAVAHEYSDMLWMTHKYIGYGLCFLLLSRMIIEMFGPGKERLMVKIKSALKLHKTGGRDAGSRHYLFVKYGYLFFYLLLLIMSVTGLGLAYEDVPFLRSIHKPLIQVHSIVQYLVYGYILVHIGGVIRAESTGSSGIVSGMINGEPV